MCGIFAYNGNKQNAAQLTLEALKILEYRGYDSWGVAIESKVEGQKSKVLVEKHVGKIGDATISLPSSSLAIGHTRWATHGGVTDANAHPHLNTDKTIAVVHNGIVENHQQIRNLLKDALFVSETDTEVVSHLIDIKMKSGLSFKDAVIKSFKDLVGSNAIVAMSTLTHEIIACRDGSPLVIGVSPNESVLASDVSALLPYTKEVYFLQDQEAVILSNGSIEVFDLGSESKKSFQLEHIEWSAEVAQKNGYPHYMLKEIVEQKDTIAKAMNMNSEKFKIIAPQIQKSSQIYVTGCGTAYHCALISTYFFAHFGIDVKAVAANEIMPFTKLFTPETLMIAISQSGETADILIAVKAAKARGAQVVALVNARGSTLERIAQSTLSVGSGPEISVVSTKAFTAQVATIYQLAQHSRRNTATSDDVNLDIKGDMASLLSSWLTPETLESIQNIAAQLIDTQDMYVIGKYENYPIAMETALKVKEASYIHAEGFMAGELKHGVIALIQKGTECVVLASEDDVKSEVLSSATELKTRGAHIIGISPNNASEYDIHIPTPNLGYLTPLANAIAGQLLGYYLSVGRLCDPDKPRNLAKSVTVK
ncbi:MAG: glutamine--fructose-6-phosphate transaminase (isomerizing) [Candidatus Roizmanbacteria bacterium]